MKTNKQQYFDILKENFDDGLELMRRKNADYAGVDDPLRNFRGSLLIGLNPGHAILLRMLDKLSRAANLLGSDAQIVSESLEDTLMDLMNYANIMKTWWVLEGSEERQKKTQLQQPGKDTELKQ